MNNKFLWNVIFYSLSFAGVLLLISFMAAESGQIMGEQSSLYYPNRMERVAAMTFDKYSASIEPTQKRANQNSRIVKFIQPYYYQQARLLEIKDNLENINQLVQYANEAPVNTIDSK